MQKLDGIIGNLMTTIAKNQVAGEEPAVGKTDTFDFSAERVEPQQLSNKTVGGGKAKLPSSDALLGNLTVVGAVDIQVSQSFYIFCILFFVSYHRTGGNHSSVINLAQI